MAPIIFAPPIAFVCYYGIVFVICEAGRRIGRSLVANAQQLIFVTEFFGTLQLCAMAYENGLVLKHYGLPGFFLAIAASVVVHMLTMGDAYACPCPIFEESALYRRSSSRLNLLLVRLAAQLAAGLAAFRLAKLVWGLGLTPDHSSLAERYLCDSDLRVPPLQGLLFEAAAAFVVRFSWLKSQEANPNGSILLNALVVPTVVVSGVYKTGMYFNPILAFSLTYGCKGTDPLEHLFVYWLGPTIGWILATEADARTRSGRYRA